MSNETFNPYGGPTEAPAAQRIAGSRSVTIRQVDVISLGKLSGTIYALLGIIFGAFGFLFSLFGIAAGAGVFEGLIGGVMMLIFLPVFYGVAGFVIGVIGAALYNLCASLVGGVCLDLDVN